MDPNGTNRVRRTQNSVPDQRPAWSPDSTKLAFSQGSGSSTDVYYVEIGSFDEFEITDTTQQTLMGTWSPDGTEVAVGEHNAGAFRVEVDTKTSVGIAGTAANDVPFGWQ